MGDWSKTSGRGRQYRKQRSHNVENQDLEDGVLKLRIFRACWCKMLSVSLQIFPKMVSCLRWRSATSGRLPARKQTTDLVVRGRSHWRLLITSLWCWSIKWEKGSGMGGVGNLLETDDCQISCYCCPRACWPDDVSDICVSLLYHDNWVEEHK